MNPLLQEIDRAIERGWANGGHLGVIRELAVEQAPQPQAGTVPAEKRLVSVASFKTLEDGYEQAAYVRGWNECRAAVLASAPGQPIVTTFGVDVTADGVVATDPAPLNVEVPLERHPKIPERVWFAGHEFVPAQKLSGQALEIGRLLWAVVRGTSGRDAYEVPHYRLAEAIHGELVADRDPSGTLCIRAKHPSDAEGVRHA